MKAMSSFTCWCSALLPALVLLSCTGNKPTADTTRRPVERPMAYEQPFLDFNVDADNGDTISLENGTRIFIPPGIFVDASGAPVKGMVQLHYRSYYTPGEIIASGITMQYDTAGKKEIFTSAGMFELNGTQNGKTISIAKDKFINMNFASTRNDLPFNFYRLDTASGAWQFLSGTKADTNELRKEILAELERSLPQKPVMPTAFDEKKPVIDIDVNINDHPELEGYDGIVWQYSGKGSDPEKNPWIYSTSWTSVQMTRADSESCMYSMKLSNGAKSFSTFVNPSLKGENYKRAVAQFNARMDEFAKKRAAKAELEKTLNKMPPYMRNLNIYTLGIHNCDWLWLLGVPMEADAEFDFDDPSFADQKTSVTVFIVSANGKVTQAFNAAGQSHFAYSGNEDNCIVAIKKGTNEAAVLSRPETAEVFKANRAFPKFLLHPYKGKIETAEDLDKLISNL